MNAIALQTISSPDVCGSYPDFLRHELDSEHVLFAGRLPSDLLPDDD